MLKKCHLFIFLLICFFLEICLAKNAPRVEEFRKGILVHQDWIQRFQKTLDPRILKLLIYRSGRVISPTQMKQLIQYLKERPEQMEHVLNQWGILEDYQQKVQNKKEEWEKAYAKESYIIESPHYIFLGTRKDYKSLKLIRYYLEKIFFFYQKKFKTEEKIEGKFLVKLYPSRSAYLESGAPEFSSAYFMGSTRELVGYALKKANGKVDVDELVHVFFHEGFHQYLHYYVPDPPTWLDEGFAKMFQGVQVLKKNLRERKLINSSSLYFVKKSLKLGELVPLEKFLFYSQKEYYANASLNYSQGWALIHFLAYGSKNYRKYYLHLMTHLRNGVEKEEAIEKTFKGVDYKKMDMAFHRYIKKLRQPRLKSRYIEF